MRGLVDYDAIGFCRLAVFGTFATTFKKKHRPPQGRSLDCDRKPDRPRTYNTYVVWLLKVAKAMMENHRLAPLNNMQITRKTLNIFRMIAWQSNTVQEKFQAFSHRRGIPPFISQMPSSPSAQRASANLTGKANLSCTIGTS
jgi:hypothetical protein